MSTVSTVWGVLGLLIAGFTGMLTYAGKLIQDLRADNKALQDKVIDRAIPAMEASTVAAQALTASTQRIMDALMLADSRRPRH